MKNLIKDLITLTPPEESAQTDEGNEMKQRRNSRARNPSGPRQHLYPFKKKLVEERNEGQRWMGEEIESTKEGWKERARGEQRK